MNFSVGGLNEDRRQSMSHRPRAEAVEAFPVGCGPDEAVELDATFVELYTTWFPRVYAFVRSQVGAAVLAQELVARVFLKAYRHRRKLPSGEAAAIWLFRIARNTVIDYWRVEGRREAANVSIDELSEVCDTHADPEALYASKERQAKVLQGMSAMCIDDRMLLSLKFTAQRTNREIASILGISEAAVSMRLLRALRRLREHLAELGVS
jgi:RNA polymerase sigma factor (sigma-70 family)